MNVGEKILKLSALQICAIIAVVSLVFAGVGYYIYSIETITVSVSEYVLHLTSDTTTPVRYQNVTFTATLTRQSLPIYGATVELLRDGSLIENNITNGLGQAIFTVNMTEVGSPNFQARYFVQTAA